MNSTHALMGGPRPVTTRLAVVAGLVAVLTIAALAPAAASTQALRPSVVVKPNLMPVKGYKYVAAPASFDSFVSSLVSTGLITGAVIKGAKDKKDIQDIVMLAQYKPKTSKALDKKPLKSILDGMVAGMQAVGGTKAVDHVLVGTHVR